MPRTPSLLVPACRCATPRCEPLEGRTLLSAVVAPADVPVTFTPISQALQTAWDQLAAAPAEAPARVRASDIDQDAKMGMIALSLPEGASSEILEFLGAGRGGGAEAGQLERQRLTLGYIARSLMMQDLDGDGQLDVFLTDAPVGPGPVHATLLLAAFRPVLDGQAAAAVLDWPLLPVPVIARDVTGDGLIDLVVTCPLTDTTWVLRGLDNGHFDDQPWLVRHVGERPVASFVEDFDGDGRLDLVTVGAASDDLTMYSDVASPWSRRQTIPSGGHHPVAALAWDVNGDGVTDLVVANHDGRLVLFLGGSAGLTLKETIQAPADGPAALASAAGNDPLRFYVAFANGEPDRWMSFTALEDAEVAPPDPLGEGPAKVSPAAGWTEGKLLALSPAGLDLVPALFRTLDGDETEQVWDPEMATGGRLDPDPVALTITGTSLAEMEPGWPEEGETVEAATSPPEQLALQRFLLGVEDVAAPALPPSGGEPAPGLMPLPTHPEEASPEPELRRRNAAMPAAPQGERPALAEEEESASTPAVLDAGGGEERAALDVGLLAGARRALVLALASHVGLGWGVLRYRRRRGGG